MIGKLTSSNSSKQQVPGSVPIKPDMLKLVTIPSLPGTQYGGSVDIMVVTVIGAVKSGSNGLE